MLLAVVLAFSPRILAVIAFLLAYAALMFASAYFCRRDWLRTGEITRWRVTVRRRWAARAIIGAFAALGAFAVILVLEAIIVGVPSN